MDEAFRGMLPTAQLLRIRCATGTLTGRVVLQAQLPAAQQASVRRRKRFALVSETLLCRLGGTSLARVFRFNNSPTSSKSFINQAGG